MHDLQYPPVTNPLLHMWLTLSPGDCLGSVIWVQQRMLPLWRVHIATSDSHLVPCVSRVWDWARTSPSPMVARERLVSAFHLLLAEIADRARHPEHAAADTREECVRIARRMLDEAHGCGLDLAALSRATGYSKYHFHRLFRDQTGQTVHQYADERRRQRADELLAAGLAHKEIAFELDFSSPSAFSRWLHQGEKERQ
jgi:AraC-like DNA-binding protein